MSTRCTHQPDVSANPRTAACEGCGSQFNLRVCATCGHVGCCESQKGHNTAHAKASGHPVIKSVPLGDGGFTWCYTCRAYVSEDGTIE